MKELFLFASYVGALALIAGVVFFVVKQLQFLLHAITLYREIASKMETQNNLTRELIEEIRRVKTNATLKEIKL